MFVRLRGLVFVIFPFIYGLHLAENNNKNPESKM